VIGSDKADIGISHKQIRRFVLSWKVGEKSGKMNSAE